jgi:hypothetical protein
MCPEPASRRSRPWRNLGASSIDGLTGLEDVALERAAARAQAPVLVPAMGFVVMPALSCPCGRHVLNISKPGAVKSAQSPNRAPATNFVHSTTGSLALSGPFAFAAGPRMPARSPCRVIERVSLASRHPGVSTRSQTCSGTQNERN